MQTLIQDLRYGARMLRKTPGFTLIAVITLALGIGANTSLFSVINAALLRQPPYRDPERLAFIWESLPKVGFFGNPVAPANYLDWKEQNRVFEDVAATQGFFFEDLNLTGAGEPERISGLDVTANFFSVLGAKPFIGRTFTPEDGRPDADGVVVISYGLWRRRFGGEAGVIGRGITLNGWTQPIVGVMPPEFKYLGRADDVWTLMRFTPQMAANRGWHFLSAIARLKPGVTIQQAQADLDAIAARQQRLFPNENKDRGAHIVPLREHLVGKQKTPLLLLFGASCLALLIACVNVANMTLARAAGRRKELAVRTALGAGRWRLIRQFAAESLPLAALGGGAGLLMALWCLNLMKGSIPAYISNLTEIRLDLRALSFTLVMSLMTGLLFGLAPALHFSDVKLSETLKDGGQSGASRRHTRTQSLLVISEMALALILLIGAGLTVRSFARLLGVAPGFNRDHMLTANLPLTNAKYNDPAKVRLFLDEALRRAEALPGAQSVAVTANLPLTGGPNMTFTVDARPSPKEVNPLTGGIRGDYFRALGIPLLKGRAFDERDTPGSDGVIIVSETLAREAWPGEDPIGKRIRMGPIYLTNPWLTVVGVVGDVRQYWPGSPPMPQAYLASTQTDAFPARVLVLRTSVEPLSLAAAARREIQAIDKDLPLTFRTMDQVVSDSVVRDRFIMLLFGLFALVALLLAAAGIYGVMSYIVAQSSHEIGVRMALGARSRDVLKFILARAMGFTLIGVAVGAAGAFGLTRLMEGLLYGVKTTDPMTYVIVPVLLSGAALLACWIPARRATKVDPMIALRCD